MPLKMDQKFLKKEDQREINDTVEFWNTQRMSCYAKDHEFIGAGSRNVKCVKCGIGYILSPESRLDSGHIFINDRLVI